MRERKIINGTGLLQIPNFCELWTSDFVLMPDGTKSLSNTTEVVHVIQSQAIKVENLVNHIVAPYSKSGTHLNHDDIKSELLNASQNPLIHSDEIDILEYYQYFTRLSPENIEKLCGVLKDSFLSDEPFGDLNKVTSFKHFC